MAEPPARHGQEQRGALGVLGCLGRAGVSHCPSLAAPHLPRAVSAAAACQGGRSGGHGREQERQRQATICQLLPTSRSSSSLGCASPAAPRSPGQAAPAKLTPALRVPSLPRACSMVGEAGNGQQSPLLQRPNVCRR